MYTKHIEITKNRPDVDLANKIKAMFDGDPDIKMEYIDATEKSEVKLIFKVSNSKKASAASAIKKILSYILDTDTNKDTHISLLIS